MLVHFFSLAFSVIKDSSPKAEERRKIKKYNVIHIHIHTYIHIVYIGVSTLIKNTTPSFLPISSPLPPPPLFPYPSSPTLNLQAQAPLLGSSPHILVFHELSPLNWNFSANPHNIKIFYP